MHIVDTTLLRISDDLEIGLFLFLVIVDKGGVGDKEYAIFDVLP